MFRRGMWAFSNVKDSTTRILGMYVAARSVSLVASGPFATGLFADRAILGMLVGALWARTHAEIKARQHRLPALPATNRGK